MISKQKINSQMFLVDKEKVCTFCLHFHKMPNFKWYICFQVPVSETENDGIAGKEKMNELRIYAFFLASVDRTEKCILVYIFYEDEMILHYVNMSKIKYSREISPITYNEMYAICFPRQYFTYLYN